MEKYIYSQPIPSSNPLNTSMHHAIILRGNKVLASAFNKVGSRSRGSGYSEKTIHAEVNVVKSLGDFSLLRGEGLGGILVDVAAEGFVAVVGSAVVVDWDVGILGVGELDGSETAWEKFGWRNGGAFFIPDF